MGNWGSVLAALSGGALGFAAAWGTLRATVDRLARQVDKLENISEAVAVLRTEVVHLQKDVEALREAQSG